MPITPGEQTDRIEALAEVRWCRPFVELDDRPAGVGLRFIDTPLRAATVASALRRSPSAGDGGDRASMTAVGHLPARVSKPEFRFRPLARADLPLVHDWINRPHVAEWWDDQRDLESVLRTFGDSAMIRMFLVYLDQDAIGYIQVYRVMGGDPE